MTRLLVNIDVPDLERGLDFYTKALGLTVGRRFRGGFVEMLGAGPSIFLLEKPAGTCSGPASADRRRYDRHWSPVHLDFIVDDLDAAAATAREAGAVQEGTTSDTAFGRIAMFADPFGHGFCLIAFNDRGYDAVAAGS